MESQSITQLAAEEGSNHVERLTYENTEEIVQMLQVKASMLAVGACERAKKIARVYPKELSASPILHELVKIIQEGPATPLAGAAMSALATLSLSPEGRQQICMLGCTSPLISFISSTDHTHTNVDKAVSLLMNLSADQISRRQIREAGAVEVLVQVMKIAPMESIMEHIMGALHNVMLTDAKATKRAADAGIAYGLARVLAARLPEGHKINVRARMIIGDLLQIPDMQARLNMAAQELKLRLPTTGSFGENRRTSSTTGKMAVDIMAAAAVEAAATAAAAERDVVLEDAES